MQRPHTRPKFIVIWEPIDDPDPEALANAFAMLFRPRPPSETEELDKNGGRGTLQEQE